MKIGSWLWISPFIFFIIGYIGMMRLVRVETVETPAVLGLSLQNGLFALTAVQLHGYILGEREDGDLAPGTIVEQSPQAGTTVKAHQSVGLLVTKRQAEPCAPLYSGRQRAEIIAQSAQEGWRVREHWIEHSAPQGCCIAQYPLAGQPSSDRLIHVYFARGSNAIRVMPDFRGRSVKAVQEAISVFEGVVMVLHQEALLPASHSCETCVVIEQKPLAGTLIVMNKGVRVHVLVADSEQQ